MLRGVDLEVGAGRDRRAARPVGLGQVDPAPGGRAARGRLRGLDPDRRRGSGRARRRRAHPRCAATLLGFVYQFHHLLPDFNARENVVLPQLVRGADAAAARERARAAARRARPRRAARPPPEQALGRRAAARRRRPRARQPARRWCSPTSRPAISTSLPPTSSSPNSSAWSAAKAAPRWSPPTTSASPPRWTACCGCTRAARVMEPERRTRRSAGRCALNPTVIALLGGVRDPAARWSPISRPTGIPTRTSSPATRSRRRRPATRRSAAPARPTYDLIKRELFRRAAQLRGSDQAAYDKLSATPCCGWKTRCSKSQDKEPARSIAPARCRSTCRRAWRSSAAVRTLTADVDYTVQPAADGSGNVVLLVTPMRSSRRWRRWRASTQPAQQPAAPPDDERNGAVRRRQPRARSAELAQPTAPSRQRGRAPRRRGRASTAPMRARAAKSRSARTAASPRSIGNMASPVRPVRLPRPTPEQQALLRATRDRFLAYRDRCPDRVHRRRLCRPHARDPRHHGRPLAAPRRAIAWSNAAGP